MAPPILVLSTRFLLSFLLARRLYWSTENRNRDKPEPENIARPALPYRTYSRIGSTMTKYREVGGYSAGVGSPVLYSATAEQYPFSAAPYHQTVPVYCPPTADQEVSTSTFVYVGSSFKPRARRPFSIYL